MSSKQNNNEIGAVVIGRNEGQRLVICLDSLLQNTSHIVYVDSGSTDNSVQEALQRKINVLQLDLSFPFTAARARNAGAEFLLNKYSNLYYLQFVDGDCELQPDWISIAYTFLEKNPEYAVACGRRRERYPEKTIYNQLCDIEWDTPIGDALACGGDALIRVTAFQQINGFRNNQIAGEEPEMCFRFRQNGWKICRIAEEMTLHDAAITTFGQWWTRAKRAGYAYATNHYLHGLSPERFKAKEVSSILVWGGLIPVTIILLAIIKPVFVALIGIYPAQIVRIMLKNKGKIKGTRVNFYYSTTTMLAKFAQLAGIAKFYRNKWQGSQEQLIEYK